MAVERTAKPAKAPVAAKAGPAPSVSHDEIQEIMNEINDLQASMAEAPGVPKNRPTAAAPKLRAVAPPPPVEEPVVEEAVAEEPVAEEASADAPGLAEFHGSSGEPSMEETMATMKPEDTGQSLLDAETAPEEAAAEAEPEQAEAEAEAEAVEAEAAEEAVAEEHEEALEEALEEEEHEEVPMNAKPAPVTPIHRKTAESPDGTLTMTLAGNMTLKLQYDFEGQGVVIQFVDQCLRIELADGTEFKIPVARAPGGRRSAG